MEIKQNSVERQEPEKIEYLKMPHLLVISGLWLALLGNFIISYFYPKLSVTHLFVECGGLFGCLQVLISSFIILCFGSAVYVFVYLKALIKIPKGQIIRSPYKFFYWMVILLPPILFGLAFILNDYVR